MRRDRIYGRPQNLAEWPEARPDEPEHDGFDAREVASEIVVDDAQDYQLTTADLREALRFATDPWAAECIRGALRDRGVIL